MNIQITRGEEILAHHTTDHPRSSYGQPVWSIEESEPDSGAALWTESDSGQDVELSIICVLDGWLVCQQKINDAFIGIIWSDGSYYANTIINRETGDGIESWDCDEAKAGLYMVKDTVAVGDFGGCLGSILI